MYKKEKIKLLTATVKDKMKDLNWHDFISEGVKKNLTTVYETKKQRWR